MADTDYLAASDGTGDAALMHVSTPRTAGATIIQVDTVVGVPAFFIGTWGTLLASGFIDPATKRDFFGHVNAGTLVIDKMAPGNVDAGNTTGQVVIIKPNTASQNLISDFIKNGVIAGTGGWNVLGPVPNTVTCNGNRSYTLVFNARDLSSSFSAGMRLRTTRTVAAPTQSTSLNGTNQYWNKTSPAGMSFTDNWTQMAWIKLSSYPSVAGMIHGRRTAATSGFDIEVEPNGQFQILGLNAGSYRGSASYQSLPLNKWIHVAATGTMSTNTFNLYINGILVPGAAVTSGTPTAIVQSGDFVVGALTGGTSLFPGKIAQAAVFSAVLSQATIQSYMSQGLAGTETSLISAYSFNGNANDLNANANNLTTNNAAAATNADSPFGGQADGSISSTLDYGIITSVAFSTNTTIVVQVPEGCTIPTTGGVSAAAYSSMKVPYGFPANIDKWSLLMLIKVVVGATAATSSAWLGLGSGSSVLNLSVPVGSWRLRYSGITHVSAASGSFLASWLTLATAAAAETDSEMTGFAQASDNATTQNYSYMTREKTYSVATQTPYYLNIKSNNGTISVLELAGTQYACYLAAECAYL